MIQCIRLKSGEDIIGETEELVNTLKIKNPAVLIIQQTQDGQMGVAMPPYVPFAKDDSISIDKDNVLFYYAPIDEVTNNYRQAYGSGIVIPEKTLLTPSK